MIHIRGRVFAEKNNRHLDKFNNYQNLLLNLKKIYLNFLDLTLKIRNNKILINWFQKQISLANFYHFLCI